jgi:hypothetical protein
LLSCVYVIFGSMRLSSSHIRKRRADSAGEVNLVGGEWRGRFFLYALRCSALSCSSLPPCLYLFRYFTRSRSYLHQLSCSAYTYLALLSLPLSPPPLALSLSLSLYLFSNSLLSFTHIYPYTRSLARSLVLIVSLCNSSPPSLFFPSLWLGNLCLCKGYIPMHMCNITISFYLVSLVSSFPLQFCTVNFFCLLLFLH